MLDIKLFEEKCGRNFTAAEMAYVRVIPLRENNVMRVVRGPLASAIQLNYEQSDLPSLEKQLEFALIALNFPQIMAEVKIYRGGSHLDLIQDGVGSLGWLFVADHSHYN